jgi:hypothetical protein
VTHTLVSIDKWVIHDQRKPQGGCLVDKSRVPACMEKNPRQLSRAKGIRIIFATVSPPHSKSNNRSTTAASACRLNGVALFGSRCKPRLNFLTGEISPLLFPHEIHAKGSEDLRIQLQQPARGSSNGSDAYDRGVVNPEVVLPSVLSRME